MAASTLEDVKGTIAREPLIGWRCLLCGEVLDPTIFENRAVPRKRLHRHPVPRPGSLVGGPAAAQRRKHK
jgi:hypothetical protein